MQLQSQRDRFIREQGQKFGAAEIPKTFGEAMLSFRKKQAFAQEAQKERLREKVERDIIQPGVRKWEETEEAARQLERAANRFPESRVSFQESIGTRRKDTFQNPEMRTININGINVKIPKTINRTNITRDAFNNRR
jgi:hypothetical protein